MPEKQEQIESQKEPMSLDTEFLEYSEGEKEGVNYVIIKGYPVTPGTHNGRVWTMDAIKRSIPKLVGAPVGVNHDYRKGLRGVVGHVSKVDWDPAVGNYVATSMIHNPEAIQRIKSGELAAYSVMGKIDFDPRNSLVYDCDYWELTLAGKPIDPGAVTTEIKEVFIAMSENDQDQPPNTEGNLSQPGGNVSMTETTETTETTENVTPPASVDVSEQLMQLSQERIALAQELESERNLRIAAETEARTEKETREKISKIRRSETITHTVSEWVANGQLVPAAEEKTVDFMMRMVDENATKAFTEIISLNQVKPFGGSEGGQSPAVVRDSEREGMQQEVIDYSKLTDNQLGAIARARGMADFENFGFFGNDAYQKNLEGTTMAGFAIKGGE